MPQFGDIVATADQAAAKHMISAVAQQAGDAVSPFSDEQLAAFAMRPLHLIPTYRKDVHPLAQALRAALIWENDANCLYRAATGAHLINHTFGVGQNPASQAFAAGIAVLHKGSPTSIWPFHCAAVVQFADRREPHVIDFLNKNAKGFTQPLSEWTEYYADLDDGDHVTLVRPFNGSGSLLVDGTQLPGHLNRHGYADMERLLHESWDDARSLGIIVRDPRTGGRGTR